MTHQETLSMIKDILELPITDWEKIIRIRKVSSIAFEDDNLHTSTLEEVKNQIVEHSGLPFESICKRSRDPEIVVFRQLAHYKACRDTNYSLEAIGRFFGNKDHATVLHSKRTIQGYLDTDRRFRKHHESFLIK